MSVSAKKVNHKGIKAVELAAGRYRALIAPSVGSIVLRLRDEKNGIELFRYSDGVPIAEVMRASYLWGLPTLYLANRFDRGRLKTSDALYQLPVNEPDMNNHLHGFIHDRAHKLKEMGADKDGAFVVTQYDYDKSDFFYNCFPVKFRLNITFRLSAKKGLEHIVTMTNMSKKMLPISLCAHTAVNAPFTEDGKPEDVKLQIPCEEKILLTKRFLPNGKTNRLDDYDKEYITGKTPVLTDINNNKYTAGKLKLDGKDFYGCIVTDLASGKKICNEVDGKYKYWLIWNGGGDKGYFCAEPMTAQINAPNLKMPADQSGYFELAPKKTYSVWQRFFTVC